MGKTMGNVFGSYDPSATKPLPESVEGPRQVDPMGGLTNGQAAARVAAGALFGGLRGMSEAQKQTQPKPQGFMPTMPEQPQLDESFFAPSDYMKKKNTRWF